MQENQNSDDEVIMLGGSNTSDEQQEENANETTAENIIEEENSTMNISGEKSDALTEENEEAKDETQTIKESLECLNKKVEQMNKLFEQKIAHTLHEEKIVDQMHAELQKYKQDMYSQLVRPILMDVIEVRDSILRMSASYESKPEGEQDVPLKVFRDYAFDVQDILEKNNITIYDGTEGDVFNPIKGINISGTPTRPPLPIEKLVIKPSQGNEFQVDWENPENSDVQFFYSTKKPDFISGDLLPISTLESAMNTLIVSKTSNNTGTFKYEGDDLIYVIAVVVKSGSAVIGTISRASKGGTVKVNNVSLVNGKIMINVELPKDVTGFTRDKRIF